MSAADGKPGPGITELAPSAYGGEVRPAGSAAIPPTIGDGSNVDAPAPFATAVPQAGFDPAMGPPAPSPYYYAPPPAPMVTPAQPMPYPAPPGRGQSKRREGPSLVLVGAIAFVIIGGVVTAIALARRPSNDDDGPVANAPPTPVTVASDPGPPAADPQSPPDPGPVPAPAGTTPRRGPGPALPFRPAPSTQPSNSKPKPKPSATSEEPKSNPFPIPIPFL